jgi:hypothetical protein
MDSPPFDPPYTTVHQSAEGIRVIESLADGTTREITSTHNGRLLINLSQGSESAAGGGEAVSRVSKPAPSTKPRSGNDRAMLFLNVPFADKDSAKRLGAKWDATKKKWYVPHGLDVNLFEHWWPDTLKR